MRSHGGENSAVTSRLSLVSSSQRCKILRLNHIQVTVRSRPAPVHVFAQVVCLLWPVWHHSDRKWSLWFKIPPAAVYIHTPTTKHTKGYRHINHACSSHVHAPAKRKLCFLVSPRTRNRSLSNGPYNHKHYTHTQTHWPKHTHFHTPLCLFSLFYAHVHHSSSFFFLHTHINAMYTHSRSPWHGHVCLIFQKTRCPQPSSMKNRLQLQPRSRKREVWCFLSVTVPVLLPADGDEAGPTVTAAAKVPPLFLKGGIYCCYSGRHNSYSLFVYPTSHGTITRCHLYVVETQYFEIKCLQKRVDTMPNVSGNYKSV